MKFFLVLGVLFSTSLLADHCPNPQDFRREGNQIKPIDGWKIDVQSNQLGHLKFIKALATNEGVKCIYTTPDDQLALMLSSPNYRVQENMQNWKKTSAQLYCNGEKVFECPLIKKSSEML